MGAQLGAAALALLAAFCFAASNVLEQRKAVEAPPETSMRIALFWYLAKQPVWWLGIIVDASGFVAQVGALGLADVVFVQPILMMSLPFSLALGGMFGAHHLSKRDLVVAFTLVASVSVFLGVASPGGGRAQAPIEEWIVPAMLVTGVVGACLMLSRGTVGPLRAALLGAAAGTIHGTSAILIRGVSNHISDDGLIHVLRYWESWALIALLPLGFLMVQSSFQAGDLRAGLPALEVAEPMIASTLGLLLLHEHVNAATMSSKVVIMLAVIGMAWTAVQLARSAAADHEVEETRVGGRPIGTPRAGHI